MTKKTTERGSPRKLEDAVVVHVRREGRRDVPAGERAAPAKVVPAE